MAADTPNITTIDVQAWLRTARKQADAVAWLEQLQSAATDAVAGGDMFVKVTSFKGQSAESTRDVNARFVQHITEHCLQQLEAEAAAAAEGLPMPNPNGVRYASFS